MEDSTHTPDLSPKTERIILAATLMALLLGALDALIVGAAMPTIVGELGGLDLYSWVFSAYLLSRAIALPIFGKLSDLFNTRRLFTIAIVIFLLNCALAGIARSMTELIVFRAFQGIGAGGIFALTYIVVADISPPEVRGKRMGIVSFVWGVSSLAGPVLGGFIVSFFSWRWIFFLNLPVGVAALVGIQRNLVEIRTKRRDHPIDYRGALTFTAGILSLLGTFLLLGKGRALDDSLVLLMATATPFALALFVRIEARAPDPLLSMEFFRIRSFSTANASAFISSFAIFTLSAYAPLFIQGTLGHSPSELGMAMVPLSLGWSLGAFVCGQWIDVADKRVVTLLGAALLSVGSIWASLFTPGTNIVACSGALAVAGFGMGLVSIATLLIVQESLPPRHLGIGTSSHQFARTLGGTIGIGVSGSLCVRRVASSLHELQGTVPGMQHLWNGAMPDMNALRHMLLTSSLGVPLPPPTLEGLRLALNDGVKVTFAAAATAALCCLIVSMGIPGRKPSR